MALRNLFRRLVPAQYRSAGLMERLVVSRTGLKVWSGPFDGMKYIGESFCSALLPKLIGIYERELHGAIEGLVRWRPEIVIDIGAAEGYYAVGLARRLPDATVLAFETDSYANKLLSRLVEINEAKNVSACGFASCQSLASCVEGSYGGQRVAVLCDCEGDELDLMNSASILFLQKAFVICELHEFVHSGISATIVDRFRDTHDVAIIHAKSRTTDDFPFRTLGTRLIPRAWIQMAVSEFRPEGMSWLVGFPRAVGVGAPGKQRRQAPVTS